MLSLKINLGLKETSCEIVHGPRPSFTFSLEVFSVIEMGNGLGPEVEDRTAPSEQVILPAWHLSEISAQTSRNRQALIFCIVCRIASLLSPLPSSDQIKLNQGLH